MFPAMSLNSKNSSGRHFLRKVVPFDVVDCPGCFLLIAVGTQVQSGCVGVPTTATGAYCSSAHIESHGRRIHIFVCGLRGRV